MDALECEGQAMFAHKRVRGEWFKLTEHELDRLAARLAGDGLHYYYEEQDMIEAKRSHLRVASVLMDHECGNVLSSQRGK